jgi:hypothetical protein
MSLTPPWNVATSRGRETPIPCSRLTPIVRKTDNNSIAFTLMGARNIVPRFLRVVRGRIHEMNFPLPSEYVALVVNGC